MGMAKTHSVQHIVSQKLGHQFILVSLEKPAPSAPKVYEYKPPSFYQQAKTLLIRQAARTKRAFVQGLDESLLEQAVNDTYSEKESALTQRI